MANFRRSHTIINAVFKGLSVFSVAIAATRLSLQYDAEDQLIRYVALTFWLIVEATAALILASISSYRVLLLNYLTKRRVRRENLSLGRRTHELWAVDRQHGELDNIRLRSAPSDVLYPLSEDSIRSGTPHMNTNLIT